jgi:hypothetical protein
MSENTQQVQSASTKQFVNVRVTKEQYKNVRLMLTEKSQAILRARTTTKLIDTRYTLQKLLAEVTAREVDGVVQIPVVTVEFVPAAEQKGKRWAYRKALTDTIAFINEIVKERNNVVSPILASETQQGAATPTGAPAEVAVPAGWDVVDTSVEASEDLPL